MKETGKIQAAVFRE